MLKEAKIKVVPRRKLSSASSATILAGTTPPNTPPTPPPLNMIMTATAARTQHQTGKSNSNSHSHSINASINNSINSNGCLNADNATTCTLTTVDRSTTRQATHTATRAMSNTSSSLLSASAAEKQHTNASFSSSASANTDGAAAAAAADTAACTSTPAAAAAVGSNASLTDHYSLRWNNHQNHILRAFDALLQTKTLVDVTLVCAETSIHAHKMVLSACSPFFQRVFAETPCKHPVIVLKDFPGWVVQAIVDFMYRGEISVKQERLQTLIQAGESLQVRGLVESSVPEHTPTPAASPDDFGMIDASLMSPADDDDDDEAERRSSFDEESPSMVTAGSKVILPSRLFSSSSARRERERKRERVLERELEREALESDEERPLDTSLNSDVCTSPMPRRKQARPRRRSSDLPLEMPSKPATPEPTPMTTTLATATAPAPAEEAQQTEPLPLTLDAGLEKAQAEHLEALKTVIKTELVEAMDEDESAARRDDSGNGNDSHVHATSHEESTTNTCDKLSEEQQQQQRHNDDARLAESSDMADPLAALQAMEVEDEGHDDDAQDDEEREDEENDDDDDRDDEHEDDNEPILEAEDMEELINATNQLRHKSLSNLSDLPEDLCTTKKDQQHTNGNLSTAANNEQHDSTPSKNNNNNNNNNSKMNNNNNNNNRIVLSLKDIRQLNKPTSSSTPNSTSNMHPFATASLRDLRIDRAAVNAVNAAAAAENQCKLDALEAQMHVAAAAAAVASGDNIFQHMEHQMDLSLAAAAAAAAVSHHQHTRERDQAMQREQQRELQEQHNAYANSILGQMGMSGLSPFGPPPPPPPPPGCPNGPGGGPSAHERLEESMNRLSKEFAPSSPMSLPSHFNPPDGPPHPPSPLPFPGMSSALALTPPHMFGLDSPLGLFPPGIDPGKLYNPLMEMSDPCGMPNEHPRPFLKGKKIPRPKGQHSAPRGGPPRSWTNNELTEALQHVWNKKMTTSQASRIFGIPYNSLLMYVRGKYGKSLKLEQLRKDCISGPPLELLQLGLGHGGGRSKKNKNAKNNAAGDGSGGGGGGNAPNNNHNHINDLDLGIPLPGMVPGGNGPRSASSEPDLMGGPNSLFGPFGPGAFYPDFPGGFPGLPLSMLNLLPPTDRLEPHGSAMAALHHFGSMDEDCKSDRSKHSSSLGDDDFIGGVGGGCGLQPLALNARPADNDRRSSGSDMLSSGGGSLGAPPPPPPQSSQSQPPLPPPPLPPHSQHQPMSAMVGGGQQNGVMQD